MTASQVTLKMQRQAAAGPIFICYVGYVMFKLLFVKKIIGKLHVINWS